MKRTLITLCALVISMATYSQKRGESNPIYSISGINPISINQSQQVNQQIDLAPTIGKNEFPMISKAPCLDTLLFEDFETEMIPATWINLDLDGTTDANARPLDWHTFKDIQNIAGTDTNDVAASSSWLTPLGQANNWMILDPVSPCIDTKLNWWSAPFEGPAYMDGYKILISTTGTNTADFTDTVFIHAESLGGTTTPSTGMIHTNYNGTNGILQEWTIDLGAYDNQTIYIAYVHDSNDDNLIMIDNIFIGLLAAFDISVLSTSQSPPYYTTPLTQVQGLTFAGDVELSNTGDVTNPELAIEIYQNITSVFTNAPNQATQLAGTINTYTATAAYIPIAVDDYLVTYTASALETDPDLSNNIDTSYFVISDSVYSREDGTFDGSLGIGPGASGFLGNMYELITTDDLTSITFTLSTPTIGDTVVAQVYDMLAGVPNQLIGSSDTLFITTATAAEYTLMMNPGPINLATGSYVVGILESSYANASLATNTEYYTPGTAWVYFNGNWGNNEDYGFPNIYYARANFGPFCSNPIVDYTNINTDFTVDFADISTVTGTSTWAWDFGDGNTSTMQNPTHTYAATGTYTVCLTITDDCGTDTSCETVDVTCTGPTAAYSEIISGYDVAFTDGSTANGTTTWAWDFGDGNTSTLQNPTHTYAIAGTYTVCLTITDNCGTDTSCETVDVTCTGPTAAYSEITTGYDVDFTDISTTNGTTTWLWDFGDGNTSTMQNPTHIYTTAGTYIVCLTVTDDCDNDSTCVSIDISDAGIEENALDYISIFPMPANDYFIVGNLKDNQTYEIELINGLGQIVKSYSVNESTQFKIELSGIAHGHYQIRIESNDEVGIKPIVIVKL